MDNNNLQNQENNFEMPNMNNTGGPILPQENNLSGAFVNEQPSLQIENQVENKEPVIEPQKTNTHNNNNLFMLIIISILVIFGSTYATVNIKEMSIVIIPIYIVVGALIFAIKDKVNSNFPNGVLLGGLITAIFTFILSITNEDKQSLWTYYAIISGASAILGLMTSSIITKIIGDTKNAKGIHILGALIYIVAIIAIPMYLYKTYPEEFYKYVFHKENKIVAETEDEFVLKTLKNRYEVEFNCGKPKHGLDENKIRVTTRTCTDNRTNNITVRSTAYDESKVLYIVEDNYLEVLYINNIKEKIKKELSNVTGASVVAYLYPKSGCSFVGDCYDSEEYNKIYADETNRDNKYEKSSNYKFSKYIGVEPLDFVNDYEFKYFIEITGSYSGMISSNYDSIVTSVLSGLNNAGFKNTSGYEIIIKNRIEDLKLPVYKVVGEASSNGFVDPKIVDIK